METVVNQDVEILVRALVEIIVRMTVLTDVKIPVRIHVVIAVLMAHLKQFLVNGNLNKMTFDNIVCSDCKATLIPVLKLNNFSDKYDAFFNMNHCNKSAMDVSKINFSFFKKNEVYNYFNKLLAEKCEFEFLNKEIFNNILNHLSPSEIEEIERKLGHKLDISQAVIFNKTLYFHP